MFFPNALRCSLIILLTCWLVSNPLLSQVDSLLSVIAKPDNDTADINAHFALVKLSVRSDREKALEHGHRMAGLAELRGLSSWAALSYRTIGVVHWMMGVQDSSLYYYQLGLERLENPASKPEIGIGLLINLGVYYQTNAVYDEAVKYFAEAYELAESSGYEKDKPKILNNLGALYLRLDRPESARRAYREAIRLKEVAKDSLGLAVTLANLGKVKLELNDLAGAEADLERSKKLYVLLGRFEEVASVDVMKGAALFRRNEHLRARETILSALDDPDLKLDARSFAEALLIVGKTYRLEGNYEQALRFLKQGKPKAEDSGVVYLQANYDRALGRVYRALGRNEEASASFSDFSWTIDTVIHRQRLATQNEVAEGFQAQLREAEIERQQLVIMQQKQGQRLLWLGLAGLALLTLSITLLLRSRLKFQRSEALRQQTAREAEMQRLQQEAELGNLQAMMQGQEAERRRVAKDLHDGLGGLLATVKARLSASEAVVPEANKMIDRACSEVRRIAHNMMPQTLALSGLSGSVQDIVAQLNLQGLDTELELVGQPDLRLDEEGQTMLLRIIQELTHNVVKHAEASKLFIQLLDQPTRLLLTVEDDGKGFDTRNLPENETGLGLSSINTRVAYLKGELQYDSSPGHGTTVTLTIPL